MEDNIYRNRLGKEYLMDKVSPDLASEIESSVYVDCTVSSDFRKYSPIDKYLPTMLIKKCVVNKGLDSYMYSGSCLAEKLNKTPRVDGRMSRDEEVYHLINSHCNKLEEIKKEAPNNRYDRTFLNINDDNRKDLEYTGLTKHARDYTIIYDISSCLDLILSEIFNIPREVIREGIASKCPSYEIFSKSILRQDEYLMGLDGFSLSILRGIDHTIDQFFLEVSKHKNKDIRDNFGHLIDLKEYKMNESQIMMSTFYMMVLRYAEFMVKSLASVWYDKVLKDLGSSVLITSIGYSSVAFQSRIEVCDSILLEFEKNMLLVRPIVVEPREYINNISRGDLICYI